MPCPLNQKVNGTFMFIYVCAHLYIIACELSDMYYVFKKGIYLCRRKLHSSLAQCECLIQPSQTVPLREFKIDTEGKLFWMMTHIDVY